MTLSATNIARVRMYLGYARAMGGGDPLQRALPGLPAEVEDLVVATLDQIATLESRLDAAAGGQHLSRVEDIEFSGAAGLASLRSEGRRLCNRLASLIGVPVMNDVFGTGGSSGGPLLRG